MGRRTREEMMIRGRREERVSCSAVGSLGSSLYNPLSCLTMQIIIGGSVAHNKAI